VREGGGGERDGEREAPGDFACLRGEDGREGFGARFFDLLEPRMILHRGHAGAEVAACPLFRLSAQSTHACAS
jgi:hypothetical protein